MFPWVSSNGFSFPGKRKIKFNSNVLSHPNTAFIRSGLFEGRFVPLWGLQVRGRDRLAFRSKLGFFWVPGVAELLVLAEKTNGTFERRKKKKGNLSRCTHHIQTCTTGHERLKRTWSFLGGEGGSLDSVGLPCTCGPLLWGTGSRRKRHACRRLHQRSLKLVVTSCFSEPEFKCI